MKTAKKAMLLTVCALVLVAATVMGTLAYLTSTDDVVNTFTVGKLAITLDEAPTDKEGNGTVIDGKRVQANDYKLIPGHHYTKDPIVHLAPNSEACYIFIEVDNQLFPVIMDSSYTVPGDNGSVITRLGILEQMMSNGWEPIIIPQTGKLYYYRAINAETAKKGADLPVFRYFDVDGAKIQTDLEPYEGKTITVTAYACQQDGFAGAAEAWAACFGK